MCTIIDFQLAKDIKNWKLFLDRIHEICMGLGLPGEYITIQNIVLLSLINKEEDIEKKQYMENMLIGKPQNNPLVLKALSFLEKEQVC